MNFYDFCMEHLAMWKFGNFGIEGFGLMEKRMVWNALSEKLDPNSACFSILNDKYEEFPLGNVYQTLLELRSELLTIQSKGITTTSVSQWSKEKQKEIQIETPISELLSKIEKRITYFDNFFDSIVQSRSSLPEDTQNLNFREGFDRAQKYSYKIGYVEQYQEAQRILFRISLTSADNLLLYGGNKDFNIRSFLDNAQKIEEFHKEFKKLPQKFQNEIQEKLQKMTQRFDVSILYTEVIDIIEQFEKNKFQFQLDLSFTDNVELSKKPASDALSASIQSGLPFRFN